MLNSDHLLKLAETEAQSPGMGAPRQANLRRAVSTAYYALFHDLMRDVAETFVQEAYWKSRVLFYRALEHGRTRERCKKLADSPLPRQEREFFAFQDGSFPVALRIVANEFVRLQELRHKCDYDPDFKIAKEEALEAVAAARNAIENLRSAADNYRAYFHSYLLFGLRA